MSFVQALRAATASDHDAVDAAFGSFALDDAAGYRRFLVAHGRALPTVEAMLDRAGDDDLPAWRPRSALLARDLAALGLAMPVPLALALTDGPALWGALYVIEGSRLGGQLLARSVPAALPSAYLSARHLPGEWRALLAAIEARAAASDDAWRDAAVAGARATFALYARAAEG
ncbi:heme oxygenase [Sphingomonas insulae]|uniref:Heme oxygenase n=1 Tax=Sphingomonas insulae TaxID=424800 RepID=A0ABP3T2C0_9SPHN|nr:biliverdin-producing heme oxygenase [Sphingomonas insulae]NIJ29982.1 heme oxygenase [Sphingomonas insulae]